MKLVFYVLSTNYVAEIMWVFFSLKKRVLTLVKKTQTKNNNLITAIIVRFSMSMSVSAIEKIAVPKRGSFNLWRVALQLSRCHLVNGAIPRKIIRGAIIGMTTALKYGGPTEILPKFKASIARG